MKIEQKGAATLFMTFTLTDCYVQTKMAKLNGLVI